MSTTNDTMLRAGGLWEKTSARGRRYLTGRLGGLRVLIFENTKRGEDGEPDWTLHFAEAPAPKTPIARRHELATQAQAARPAPEADWPDDAGR